jgi:hypothetical protein
MGALSASAAQAEPKFTGFDTVSGKHVHTTFKGTTEPGATPYEAYKTGGGAEIRCHNTYEGTSLTGEDKDLTVNVTNWQTPGTTAEKHCTAFFAGATFRADIDFNGCHYVFHAGTKIVETMEYTGTVDIVCDTEGKKGPITVKVTKADNVTTKCTLKVPAQNGLSHVIYKVITNPEPEKTDVTVEATINKESGKAITYTSEGGILNCGESDGEHVEGSQYNGKVTVQGFDTLGNQVDADISG